MARAMAAASWRPGAGVGAEGAVGGKVRIPALPQGVLEDVEEIGRQGAAQIPGGLQILAEGQFHREAHQRQAETTPPGVGAAVGRGRATADLTHHLGAALFGLAGLDDQEEGAGGQGRAAAGGAGRIVHQAHAGHEIHAAADHLLGRLAIGADELVDAEGEGRGHQDGTADVVEGEAPAQGDTAAGGQAAKAAFGVDGGAVETVGGQTQAPGDAGHLGMGGEARAGVEVHVLARQGLGGEVAAVEPVGAAQVVAAAHVTARATGKAGLGTGPGIALQKIGDGHFVGGAQGFVAGDLGDHRQQAGVHVLPLVRAHVGLRLRRWWGGG
jgi:hypothetical protein